MPTFTMRLLKFISSSMLWCWVLISFTQCRSDKDEMIALYTLDNIPSASSLFVQGDAIVVTGEHNGRMYGLNREFKVMDSSTIIAEINSNDIPSNINTSGWIDSSTLLWLYGGKDSIFVNASRKRLNEDSVDHKSVALIPQIHANDIPFISIEGMATTHQYLFLANKATKDYPNNELLYLRKHFWESERPLKVSKVKIGFQPKHKNTLIGITGMDYHPLKDRLFLTVTETAQKDGTVEKNYLWVINNISGKLQMTAINPDWTIDLTHLNESFQGKKATSVALIDYDPAFSKVGILVQNQVGSTEIMTIKVSERKVKKSGTSFFDL